jgi:hypothetical protein
VSVAAEEDTLADPKQRWEIDARAFPAAASMEKS